MVSSRTGVAIGLGLFSFLMLVASLFETIFAGITLRRLHKFSGINWDQQGVDFFYGYGTGDGVGWTPLPASADGFGYASDGRALKGEVAAGILGMTMAILGFSWLAYAWVFKKDGKGAVTVVLRGFMTILTIVIVGLFGFVFEEANTELDFSGSSWGWNGKHIAWEKWTCDISGYIREYNADTPAEAAKWFHKSCTLNKGSRMTMIALLILAVLTTLFAWLMQARGSTSHNVVRMNRDSSDEETKA